MGFVDDSKEWITENTRIAQAILAILILLGMLVILYSKVEFTEVQLASLISSSILSNIIYIIILIVIITSSLFILRRLDRSERNAYLLSKMAIRSDLDKMDSWVEFVSQNVSQKVSQKDPSLVEKDSGLNEKKNKFKNISTVSFHFVNEEEIKNFYNDYFKEPTIEQAVNEIVKEVGGELKGNLPQILEAKAQGKDLSKWISTIKIPDISLAEKFRRYQRSIIESDQVTLGLELVDIDLSDLNAFNGLVTQFESKFSMKLDSSMIEQQRSSMKKRAAEKTIIRLENATSWVLIDGKFIISELPNATDFYKCTYEHPVNEYLGIDANKITISMVLRKDSILPSYAGNYAQSIGKSIPLNVYGKIWAPVDRKSGVWELQINPAAVY